MKMIKRAVERKNEAERAIVETVAYFDMFDFPLTAAEIVRYAPLSLDIPLPGKIKGLEEKNGFYFLSGREEIVEKRLRRYPLADGKFKKALRFVRLLRFLPGIKLVALANLMGQHNLRSESDLDLFIVAAPRALWLTRFFSVSLAALLGLRPKEGMAKDRICLNFFLSEDSLALKDLMIADDIYFVYWLADLHPLYDRARVYEKLIVANPWILSRLPSWRPIIPSRLRTAKKIMPDFLADFLNYVFAPLEKFFMSVQARRLPLAIASLMNKDTRVVISKEMIKTHTNDRREYYRDLWLKKIKEYGQA